MAPAVKSIVNFGRLLSVPADVASDRSGQSKAKSCRRDGNTAGSSPSNGRNYCSSIVSRVSIIPGAKQEATTHQRRHKRPLTHGQQIAAATRMVQLADYNLRVVIHDIDAGLLQHNDWETRLYSSATAKIDELYGAAKNVAALKKLRYSPKGHIVEIWHGIIRIGRGRRELDGMVGRNNRSEGRAKGEIRAGMDDALKNLVQLRAALV